MDMFSVVFAAAGLLVGMSLTALVMFVSKGKGLARLRDELDEVRQRLAEKTIEIRGLETERAHLQADLEDRKVELERARQAEAALRVQASDLTVKLTEIEATRDQELKAHEEKRQELIDVRKNIEDQIKVMANDLMEKNTEGFLKRAQDFFEGHHKTSKQSVENLVKPMGEALKGYQDKLAEMEKERKRDEGEIVQQLRSVAETHGKLKDMTSNLVNALRSAPKTRGRWGEQQLKTVLEMAGMMEHVDFLTEHSVEGEDEKKLRPDVVLRLPGGRQIVVDAKTPMAAYLDAVEAASDEEREQFLRKHARDLRVHAEQLGSKKYWQSLPEVPDFVVLFVPGDNLYAAAIERDPDLFEFAYDKQIIIATPTTFLALAKAIAFGWRQERASQNAQRVMTEGSELYKRLQGLGEKVMRLSKSLDQTVTRHNEFVASLETRVLPQGRKLNDLGVGTAVGDLAEMLPVEKTPRLPLKGRDLQFTELEAEDDDGDADTDAEEPELLTAGGK